MFHLARLLLLLVFLACPGRLPGFDYGELGNSSLSLRIDPANGGIAGFSMGKGGINLVNAFHLPKALWSMDLATDGAPVSITPAMAGRFHWEYPRSPGRALKMVWEDFDPPEVRPLRVEVRVRMDPVVAQSRWTIRIQKPRSLGIERVRFPRLPAITRLPQERLAVPVWMGQLTRSPRELVVGTNNATRRFEWRYPGALSLQCLALYSEEGPGLYLACDDTRAFPKDFAVWGNAAGHLAYEMVHYPENEARSRTSYTPAYHALMGVFQGDWITAAERYRRWGTNQVWARRSRLNQRQVPDWLPRTALWVWNRGPSGGVVEPALDLAREGRLPVSIFWHWWHGCAYDSGFPEYLPPREGTERFVEALRKARAQDTRAIVYMNQRLWGLNTRSWSERRPGSRAVVGADRRTRAEVYNTYTEDACVPMCVATRFWRDTYASLAATAVRDLGVDGIYMDQACASMLCYDPGHGHPPGGGAYWVRGSGQMANEIRTRTRGTKAVLLAGEGVGEAWLPHLDLMLALQVSRERYAKSDDGWTTIPFFHAVYHSCAVIYGNYSSLTIPPYDELWPAEFAPKEPLQLLDRKFSTQFYLEQARTFAWGNQPTLANYLPSQRQTRPDEISYVLRLARVRQQGLKYLLHGTFLRPPALTNAWITFPVSRLSIYAGRKGKAEAAKTAAARNGEGNPNGGKEPEKMKEKEKEDLPPEISSPPLICGAWAARDNTVGIALANITSNTVPFQMDVRPYGFAPGDRLRMIDETGARDLGRVGADGMAALGVKPRDAVILELRR
jgi:hypothetical protein